MVKDEHNHQTVTNDIKAKEMLEKQKVNAASTLQPMQSLYEEGLIDMRDGSWNDETKAMVVAMPTFPGAWSSLYRARRAVMPPLPLRREDLVFLDEYKTTISGDPFLLIDDGHDKRILGFSTANNLLYLCESDTIYGDGTFYVAPTIFHQLYTIHGMVDGNMFPLVFFFLPDKKEDTYTRMFRQLVDAAATRGHHLYPQKIQMDYEVASRNASAIMFPQSEWKGCFFHFTQCVWRRTQQHHLQKDYQDDDEIKRFVRRCVVLPLVPAQEVEDLWLENLATMPDDDCCRQLRDYMTNFWMEGDLHMMQWHHHNSDGPRTNKHLEGWHSCLKKYIGKAHPNVFKIVSFLSREQTNSMLLARSVRPRRRSTGTWSDDWMTFVTSSDKEHCVRHFADSASHLLHL